MGRKKQNKPYVIPSHILDMLNEHCNKGWMLFTYDDQNTLRLYCNFDDTTVAKALRSDIETYVTSIKQLETDMTIQKILEQNNPPSED